MGDVLYAVNSVLMLVVAVLTFWHWLRLPRTDDNARVRLVVLAVSLVTLSDGIRYWWFAVYRIIGAPAWMLDHAAVVAFTGLGTAAALMLLKLYGPGAIGRVAAVVTVAVAAVLYHFM